MKLRPHHLLCLQKYTGKGYDEAFTAHMNGLLGRLTAHPEGAIQLTEGADDLCAACPHNAGGRCDSQEKVTRMDRGVLAALDLSYGQRDSWDALARRAAERVLSTEEFQRICADCQWIELCRNTRKGWIDGNNA